MVKEHVPGSLRLIGKHAREHDGKKSVLSFKAIKEKTNFLATESGNRKVAAESWRNSELYVLPGDLVTHWVILWKKHSAVWGDQNEH